MDRLGLFAKYWEPGRVKTRLAATIGNLAASRVYRAFVTSLVIRFRKVADERIFVFSPMDRQREFAKTILTDWHLVPQSSGDLGARMKHFFSDSLRRADDRVVLIGSDSPTLPAGVIDDAFEALRHSPVVLGPTNDGGYYLVGAAGTVPPIFDDVRWSTTSVWQQTVDRLLEHDTPFVELPSWYDVDELDDLRRLDRELQSFIASDPTWVELANEVRECLHHCDSTTA